MRGRYGNLLLVCDVADQFIEVAKGDSRQEDGMRERIVLALLHIESVLDIGRAIPGPADATEETRHEVNRRMDQIRAEISALLSQVNRESLLDSVNRGATDTALWIRAPKE